MMPCPKIAEEKLKVGELECPDMEAEGRLNTGDVDQ
jgi:hypothetical protein